MTWCNVIFVIFSSDCEFCCQFSILVNSTYLQTLYREDFTLIDLNIQDLFVPLLLISLLFQYCGSTTRIFSMQLYLNVWRSVLWYIHLILRQQFSVPTQETCSSLAVACACSSGCCIHIMNCKFRLNPFPIETSTRQTNKQKDNEEKKNRNRQKHRKNTEPKQTPQTKVSSQTRNKISNYYLTKWLT